MQGVLGLHRSAVGFTWPDRGWRIDPGGAADVYVSVVSDVMCDRNQRIAVASMLRSIFRITAAGHVRWSCALTFAAQELSARSQRDFRKNARCSAAHAVALLML